MGESEFITTLNTRHKKRWEETVESINSLIQADEPGEPSKGSLAKQTN